MTTKNQYTRKGDTWYQITEDCPRCQTRLTSNGRIDACTNCDYWTLPTDDD